MTVDANEPSLSRKRALSADDGLQDVDHCGKKNHKGPCSVCSSEGRTRHSTWHWTLGGSERERRLTTATVLGVGAAAALAIALGYRSWGRGS